MQGVVASSNQIACSMIKGANPSPLFVLRRRVCTPLDPLHEFATPHVTERKTDKDTHAPAWNRHAIQRQQEPRSYAPRAKTRPSTLAAGKPPQSPRGHLPISVGLALACASAFAKSAVLLPAPLVSGVGPGAPHSPAAIAGKRAVGERSATQRTIVGLAAICDGSFCAVDDWAKESMEVPTRLRANLAVRDATATRYAMGQRTPHPCRPRGIH